MRPVKVSPPASFLVRPDTVEAQLHNHAAGGDAREDRLLDDGDQGGGTAVAGDEYECRETQRRHRHAPAMGVMTASLPRSDGPVQP